MCAVDNSEDLRHRFLEALTGRAPAQPPAASPEAPADPQAPSTDVTEPAAEPSAPTPTAPLSFEQSPPPPEEVPAAMAALAVDPDPPIQAPASAGAAPLMDLGTDAQIQGTQLGLHSIGVRLAVISEGLKLIPILAGVSRDLENLNYPEVAAAVDALMGWVQGEEKALMSTLEERTAQRQGQPPSS